MAHRILPLLLIVCALSARADDTKKPYGFRGFEVYKLDHGITGLTAFDADGDGLQDLLLINNRRAKIEVLLRRKDPVPPKMKTGKKLPNDLVDDRFFERKEILTEKQVWAVAVGDLNGDGKQDVAYYGKPDELVVAYGDGKGGFGKTSSYPIEDVYSSSSGLAVGDLNGDGRADLALIAKGYTSIYAQTDKGTLAEPGKVPHAVKGVTALGIQDLDGDGRNDLLHFVPASRRSMRVRFGGATGLGAEIALETTAWRNLDLADLSEDKGAEVVVVQRTSGVLRSLKVTAEPAVGDVKLGSVEMHAFAPAGGGKARAMAIGDVNGDKRSDVVVTEPGTAQVALYLQGSSGSLAGRRTYPSLSDSSALRVADLDGDARAEVIVLSSKERAVGVSSLGAEGRLPFPTLLPLGGATPKAMDVGDLNGDGKPDLAVVVEKDKKRKVLVFSAPTAAPTELDLPGLRNAPDDLMIMDLDQDGKADLLLFDRFGAMHVRFPQRKELVKIDQVQKLGRGNVGTTDVDGDGKPELLITSKNFARAVVYEDGKGIRIKDQANGRAPTSQIKGIVALAKDLALFDRDKNRVSILRRGEGGVFGVAGNLPIGDIEYQGMFAADLNTDGSTDLVVFGKNRFGVLFHGGKTYKLAGIHSIESSVRDAILGSFAVGDLNGDGQPDLAVLDTGNRGIQIFSYSAKDGFKERLSWPVYEKKMHEQRRRTGGARELVIADLDGDGKNDIALLVHDRVIVYPQ